MTPRKLLPPSPWPLTNFLLTTVSFPWTAVASSTSGSDLGHFMNPPDVPTGFLDYSLNPTYDIGSLQKLTWTTPFERINLYITQMKVSNESKHTLQYNHSNTGSFNWTVTSFEWDLSLTRLSPGKVAFFGIQNAAFPYQAIYSAYFNFSTGDKTVVEDVQGATVTVISAPTGVSNPSDGRAGLSHVQRTAVGLGVALGLLLLLAIALAGWLTWRLKQLREQKAKAVYIPPASAQRTRPAMASRPVYVLSEHDIPIRYGSSQEAQDEVSSTHAASPGSERRGLSTSDGIHTATLIASSAGHPGGRQGEWMAESHESIAFSESLLRMYDN